MSFKRLIKSNVHRITHVTYFEISVFFVNMDMLHNSALLCHVTMKANCLNIFLYVNFLHLKGPFYYMIPYEDSADVRENGFDETIDIMTACNTRKETFIHLRKVSFQISLRSPRRLI